MEAASVPEVGESPSKFTTDLGGKAPTSATIVTQGGEFEVPEQYETGQILELRVVVEVGEGRIRHKKDPKTGTVVDCTRVHVGRITSLKVARAVGEVETGGAVLEP